MFIPSDSGAEASTPSATPAVNPASAPVPREQVRHMLFGSPAAVQYTIHRLHQRGYAEVNDWSRLLSTGRAGEVMAILTQRVEM